MLLAFYLAEGNQDDLNYNTFLKNYEQKVSDAMYDGYKADYDKFHFYLIHKEDKNQIDQFDLKENQLLVLDGSQAIIFRQKASMPELSQEVIAQVRAYSRNEFYDLNLMKRLDTQIESNTFDAKKTQSIFKDIASITSMDFFSGHESVKKQTYLEKEFIKKNIDYYKLQSNLEEVNSLYDKLIESHKNDDIVDLEFANIVRLVINSNYKFVLYRDYEPSTSETELKSIDYLIKFQDELVNYKAVSDDDYKKGYDFYYLKSSISSALNRSAEIADDDLLQKIKPRFKNLKSDNNEYLTFLKRFIPKDFLNEYKSYYDSNKLHNTDNIIVKLDEMYEETNSKQAWDIYKNKIGNEANEAAWVVVEEKSNKKFLKEALKWS